MATCSSTQRHASARQRHENRRRANPWRTQTAPRLSTGRSEEVDSHLQVARVEHSYGTPDGSILPGDVLALVALLASAIAALSVTLYGVHYVLSQISALSTAEVLRVFGGIG